MNIGNPVLVPQSEAKTTMEPRVLLLTHTDDGGGAARAAYRLLQGLVRIGVDARMMVGLKHSSDPHVYQLQSGMGSRLRVAGEHLIQRALGGASTVWSNNWLPARTPTFSDGWRPDVVNIHWIGHGFLPLRAVRRLRVPQVWTLHDIWSCTGGCHYPGDCLGYADRCARCPRLRGPAASLVARWNLAVRKRHFAKARAEIVGPSRWIVELASRSKATGRLPLHVIPYGLDLQAFRPFDKATARDLLGLPADRFLVGFGALRATTDPRKGFDLLDAALQQFGNAEVRGRTSVVVFGGDLGRFSLAGIDGHGLGNLHDDLTLALAYSAMDCFIAPSREENLAQTVLEAQACGVPALAFSIGGMPDLIEHRVNGWLARPFDAGHLAEGMVWAEAEGRHSAIRLLCRSRAEDRYGLERQALAYRERFRHLTQI